ncbi:uncharacterized protein LOC131009681 [Salvia miltiorrhiza]|uniref:uncharacterized protein LOC131009681 n=1 Tax=Salvia miltiorrhiza TaxID=226208 RepID=UPI0025AD0637|nr:uncharacterized protein LOC131009681 [Salvia miltiorrhiza]
MNTDGSFDSQTQHGAGGGVVRDHSGALIVAFCSLCDATSSFEAKLTALLEGLRFAIIFSDHIWVEMNAAAIVLLMSAVHHGHASIRHTVVWIRQLIQHRQIRQLKEGKAGMVALKLDMSKAYDRVEWTYLEAVIQKLGFLDRLRRVIMKCMRLVPFSFLMNMSIFDDLVPSRGLRQGDPLSPFLFVLYAQGISFLFHRAQRKQVIHGVPIVPGGSRYPSLSQPPYVPSLAKETPIWIMEKIQKKLACWNQREFIGAGIEVLLKAVIQSIPTYAMQCFRHPDSICEDINRLSAGFWWGDKEDKRYMHWRKLDALCTPKEWGGMARYFREGDIMNAEVRPNTSYIWRSLAWSRDLIERGQIWKVEDEHKIKVFDYVWAKTTYGIKLARKEDDTPIDIRVADLFDEERAWDRDKIQRLL